MAFRLIDDMGICVDGKRYAGAGRFSAEDIEIRNRLFWSCYFWVSKSRVMCQDALPRAYSDESY